MGKSEQKFHYGDLVRVAKNLGSCMSHFTADVDAIVIGSYDDQYGGGDVKSYTLHIKDQGQVAWYYEGQLALIEAGRADLLNTWQQEREELIELRSNLDWIFANGPEVATKPHGASVEALAKCFGVDNLWGRNGEGFVYYENAMRTLGLAKPYLETKDKAGYLAKCAEIIKAD